jgi:hypothetical protein
MTHNKLPLCACAAHTRSLGQKESAHLSFGVLTKKLIHKGEAYDNRKKMSIKDKNLSCRISKVDLETVPSNRRCPYNTRV